MKKLLTILSLALLSSCSPKTERHGLCSHPGVLGGMPFELNVEAKVEPEGVITITKNGAMTVLIGAQCLLEYVPIQKK